MSDAGAALAEAAEQLIGAPFRLRGRDPQTGIDCIGLVHCALLAIERIPPPVPAYTLRNVGLATFMPLLSQLGFARTDEPDMAGDLVLLHPSPGQFHIGIVSVDHHLIHAHAGLRRVVKSPRTPAAPELSRWRLA
ncbi:NlpC/P60 family protein [Aurantiacibacter sediminis]|uniref:NlpC/P60 domain-containing protein n=1 Tax=Aurantiacibacter sediminis TaxID=2793064 RepID=A0ABS0N0Q2_9SPHN|nr:NlpC/P60 family protein [Aurantiacibacter sediminis]MBH5321547.1 hypothetical protein [Aurantiacibacter sediminis]